jgi:glyoxylase-like metal-dependent hydrolase (beta-lactamase superfamily II)
MAATRIVGGLYGIPVGPVNMFLLESSDGCILIDTGLPASADKVLGAITELGKKPTDIRHIVLTHAHPDHIGSFAALKKATGATAYMHPADAAIATSGTGFRPMKAAPGVLKGIMFRLFVRLAPVEGGSIEHLVEDGEHLPGNLTAIHVPGHCAGQLALLWPQGGGVLFVADACSNMMGLGWSLGYEDFDEGKRSLRRLSALSFNVACFGHGKAILHDASLKFKEKWAANVSANRTSSVI